MTPADSDSIWTRTFALLCAAQFFGYGQQFLLQPAFPLYITHLGGSPFVVGVVLTSFAATSVIFRPFLGYWVDRWSETGVMVLGILLLGIGAGLCYIPLVGTTMFANGLRGIGWAGLNSGGYSVLAECAPFARRGEASGYYTAAQSCATICFPAVGLWILGLYPEGFWIVFLVAIAVAVAGAAVGLLLGRSLPHRSRTVPFAETVSWWREFFNLLEREVRLPAALIFCLQFSLPGVTSFIVLYALEIGIDGIASFFIVGGVVSLLARPLLGRVSDIIGRGRSVAAAFVFQVIGLILLLGVSNLAGLLIAGVLYMLGTAIGSATILALAVERANPERRGRALASFSVAYPLSYGVGSFMTGSIVELGGYFWMYSFLAAFGVLALAVTLANWSSLK